MVAGRRVVLFSSLLAVAPVSARGEGACAPWSGPAWLRTVHGTALRADRYCLDRDSVLVEVGGERQSLRRRDLAAVVAAEPRPVALPPALISPTPLPRRQGSFNILADAAPPSPPESSRVSDDHPMRNYRDRQGRDEAWWRRRLAKLAERLDTARSKLEMAARRLDQARRGMRPVTSRSGADADASRVARASAEVAAARGEIVLREAELGRLRDEARRAGALPAWLR